jgi:hypothetical protein
VSGRERLEAERRAQVVELLVAGVRAVIESVAVIDAAKLVGHETERLGRDDLPWPQEPAGVAQGTKLQSEAQPVARPAPLPDRGKVGLPQRPVADQVRLKGGQGEQRVALRGREDDAAGYGCSAGCKKGADPFTNRLPSEPVL